MAEKRSVGRVRRFLDNGTDRVYRAVAKGPVGRFFSAYPISDGMHSNMLLRPKRRKRKGNSLRRGLARAMDRSFLRRLVHSLLSHLCSCSLRTLGMLLFTSGVYAAIVGWLVSSVWRNGSPDAFGLFLSASFALVGFLMLFSGVSVGRALGESRVLGRALSEVLGLGEETFTSVPVQGKQGYAVSVPLGMLLGTLAAIVGPLRLLLIALIVAIALIIFSTPESGVLLLILALPFAGFLPYHELCLSIGVLLALSGYVCKLLRGTRAFRMEVQDSVVLLMLLCTLLGGISAADGAFSRVLAPAMMMALYFPAVNMLATPQWLKRCRRAFLGTATVASMLGILQFVFKLIVEIQSPRALDMITVGEAVRAGFADRHLFAYFLLIAFPFALYAFARERSHHRLPAGLACVSIVIATLATWVQSAWLTLLVELLVMCLVYAKRIVPYVAALLLASPAVLALLPTAWREALAHVILESSDLSATRLRVASDFASQVFFEGGNGFFGRGEGLLRLLFGLGDGGVAAISVLYTDLAANEVTDAMSFWLYRLMEGGLLGVLLPALLAFLLLQNCFSLLQKTERARAKEYMLPVVGVVMTFGTLFFSCFRYSWHSPAALLAFFAALSLITADARYHRAQNLPFGEVHNGSSYAEMEYQIKGGAKAPAEEGEEKDEP